MGAAECNRRPNISLFSLFQTWTRPSLGSRRPAPSTSRSSSFTTGSTGYQVSGALPVIRVISKLDHQQPLRTSSARVEENQVSTNRKQGRMKSSSKKANNSSSNSNRTIKNRKSSYDYEQKAMRNRAGVRTLDGSSSRRSSFGESRGIGRARMRAAGGKRPLRK